MSTFDVPRLHFTGRFQADTSTVNNDVRHYKSDAFLPQFQEKMVGHGQGENQRTNGYWNPEGSGAWRMLGCRVSAATGLHGPVPASSSDAVLELRLGGSSTRVAGKLVDLDPQQQMVSQIWGLEVSLVDPMGRALVHGRFVTAPFIDLWQRQQVSQNFDQTLAAVYQSRLMKVEWGDLSSSPFLQSLRAATREGQLSMRFNVFGFDRDPNADDYMTGKVVGTIGPVRVGEPVFFTTGRQLVPSFPGPFPVSPAQGVNTHTAVVHEDRRVVTVDVGNALPIVTAAGDPMPMGELLLAVAKDQGVEEGGFVPAGQLSILGPIPYQAPSFQDIAGVVDLDYSSNAEAEALLADHPVVLVQQLGTQGHRVLVRETRGGMALRADQLVHRLDPGKSQGVDVYVTRWGKPCPATVSLGLVPASKRTIGGPGTGANLNEETWPVPQVCEPEEALIFPGSATGPKEPVHIDATGKGRVTLEASAQGPGNPRGYLDGQVYAVQLDLVDGPEGWHTSPWYFLSVLCWDALEPDPEQPTWHRDIEPIFRQYGNLYPIMSRHWVDLGDYDQVVSQVRLLKLVFSLPEGDPNHMPVTRDLSSAKRAMILRWLREPGTPERGQLADRPAPRTPRYVARTRPAPTAQAPDPAGKLDFLAQVVANRDANPDANPDEGDA
ncbi:MAG: hypothetical protein KDK70_05905 [Myxococcales bacterium]|nr:hypothetical protein [Myxococcales bacterium]